MAVLASLSLGQALVLSFLEAWHHQVAILLLDYPRGLLPLRWQLSFHLV